MTKAETETGNACRFDEATSGYKVWSSVLNPAKMKQELRHLRYRYYGFNAVILISVIILAAIVGGRC